MIASTLPPGILKSDLEHKGPKNFAAYETWLKGDGILVEPRTLTLYETERFGWIITTLLIRNGASHSVADRTYGITLKGELVRVGFGPHVKQKITVYVHKVRLAALQKYIDLYNTGMIKAHESRDTLSSRRASTVARRRSFW